MNASINQSLRHVHSVFLPVLLCLFLTGCYQQTSPPQHYDVNPLEAYLAEPHPSYSYELKHTADGDGYTTYVLRMISQEWLTEDLVNETEWWHWVTMVVPDQLDHDTALLWIGGGTHYSEMPEDANEFMLTTALETNSVAVNLHNVPYQPLSFTGDTLEQRYEDDLIAYGWREFMEGGARDDDAVWLARLPMTTAAIRAMDTVTDFSAANLDKTIDRFVVAGASKRGWTAWTTGIFDDRVVAIAPAVIDLLNMLPSFEHHWQAYGEWSPAIREYEHEKIMDWQHSREYARLRELVDPYSYLDRLEMPKFIVNASSDEFFLPDSWQFYWDDLPGDKHLRYVPNTGHSLSGTDAVHSLISFHYKTINGISMPEFHWSVNQESIRIETDPENPPESLKLWRADNPETRDFRLYVIDRTWENREIPLPGNGVIDVELEIPGEGYSAYFVEANFPGTENLDLKLTSGVVILPDTYPHEPFETDNPMGTPK